MSLKEGNAQTDRQTDRKMGREGEEKFNEDSRVTEGRNDFTVFVYIVALQPFQ